LQKGGDKTPVSPLDKGGLRGVNSLLYKVTKYPTLTLPLQKGGDKTPVSPKGGLRGVNHY